MPSMAINQSELVAFGLNDQKFVWNLKSLPFRFWSFGIQTFTVIAINALQFFIINYNTNYIDEAMSQIFQSNDLVTLRFMRLVACDICFVHEVLKNSWNLTI